MTTLYRPVLIETAAQAEALPEGSIVINDDGDRYSRHPRWGEWHSVADDRDLTEDLDSTFRPPTITALVPIEAEEETVVAIEPGNPYAEASMDSDGNVWFGGGIFPVDVTEKFNQWASKNQRTRYVTPWEVA